MSGRQWLGPSPSALHAGTKNSREPLRPIGGTGQGVSESKTGALLRSNGEAPETAKCRPANPGPGSYDTERQAGAPMTPLGALADRGFADVEHIFNCSVWDSDGATVALAL